MYLCEKDGEFIKIYHVSADMKKIYDYKKRELLRLSEKEKVFIASSNDRNFLFLENCDSIDYSKLNYHEETSKIKVSYHSFNPYSNNNEDDYERYCIIENYCKNGISKENKVISIENSNSKNLNHIVITKPYIIEKTIGLGIYKYVMRGIINLTPSLHALHLYAKGKRENINEKHLKEIIELLVFSNEPVLVLDKNDIEKLQALKNFGVINFESLNSDNDEKELSLIRKIKGF